MVQNHGEIAIPDKGEHLVRYYGHYSNVSRGKREKAGLNQKAKTEETADTPVNKKKINKNWARLIKKVFFVDPLLCPGCGAKMKVISSIREKPVIEKILKHVGLWEQEKTRPPPAQPKIITAAPEIEYVPFFD